MATVNVEREALEAIRDGFVVVKALLSATPEELANADKEAIVGIVNGGYEVLANLLWQADPAPVVAPSAEEPAEDVP